jgi:hypothetical protein
MSMVGDPTVSAASLTLTSIMKIFAKYQAYQSSKIHETDQGLREEIARRLEMIQRHLDTLEVRFLTSKNAEALEVVQRIRESSEHFRQDTLFGSTGSTDAVSISPKLNKSHIKAVMEHDLEVLKRLVESTHLVNEVMDLSSRKGEFDPNTLLPLEQKLVGVRNRFADRVSFLAKL